MRTLRPLALALVLTAAACPGSSGEEQPAEAPTEELTRRQKDSLISAMPLPGARGVGSALRSQDAAAERARRLEEESNR